MPRYEITSGRRSPATRITLLILVLFLLFGVRSFSGYAIEIEWWKELGQLNTWFSMLYYSIAPVAAATLLAFGALWIAHARALKFAGTGRHAGACSAATTAGGAVGAASRQATGCASAAAAIHIARLHPSGA